MKQLSLRKQVHNSFRVFFIHLCITVLYPTAMYLPELFGAMLQYFPGTCHELCYLPSSRVLCHKHKHSLVTAGDQSVATNLHKRNEE
jgi:hypothetical protein